MKEKLYGGVIFMKQSRQDNANVVGEFSQVMDGANNAAFLDIHLVIKYCAGHQKSWIQD